MEYQRILEAFCVFAGWPFRTDRARLVPVDCPEGDDGTGPFVWQAPVPSRSEG